MPLVNPNKKEKAYNPNVDNTIIESNANSGGVIITYLSFVLILPLILYIIKRNTLVKLQMRINESSSGIDIQLKKRRSTLIKLFDVVKGSMKFEKDFQNQITKLRSGKTNSPQEIMDITNKVASAININVEAYPELKTITAFKNLMSTSTDIELEIAASRRLYNSYVNRFNTEIFIWPSSVVATSMKLKKMPLFAASDEDRKDVELKF